MTSPFDPVTVLCGFRPGSGVRVLWALLGLGLAPSAQAQTTIGGQIRPRFEARDPAAGGSGAFTSMRTRVVLRSKLADDVRTFIQVQALHHGMEHYVAQPIGPAKQSVDQR